MKFRESSPPPYLNRADQARMLRMAGVLVLVLIGMKFAADPGMWAWMFPAESQTESSGEPASKKDIDYSVKFDEESPLPPDAFWSRLPESRTEHAHSPAIAEASPQRATARRLDPSASNNEEAIAIDPEILAPVSDGWFGIRKHEAPAFFAIIAKAKRIPLDRLEAAGDPSVDYTVLMTESQQFRGQPLTVRGTIRMIESVSISDGAGDRNQGVDHYYVAWMWTDSSGDSPYRLIATSLPEDMPQGKNLDVPAKFTGYFFKQEGYRTEQGTYVAPVLIGRKIHWNRPAAIPGTTGDMGVGPYIAALIAMIALGVGLLIWRFRVSDKKFGQKHIDYFTTASPSDLEELEAHDPNELFRQMEAEERDAEKPGEDEAAVS